MLIKTIENILSRHTGYEISKAIGVQPHQINRLKSGERKIENISLSLAEKTLNHYAVLDIKMKD